MPAGRLRFHFAAATRFENMPRSSHRIRLVGPWDLHHASGVNADWQRLHLPEDWNAISQLSGLIELRRRFHCPTGIGADDQVYIVVPASPSLESVRLNGTVLAASGVPHTSDGQRYGAVGQLQPHNTLQLSIRMSAHFDEKLKSLVMLEIVSDNSPPEAT